MTDRNVLATASGMVNVAQTASADMEALTRDNACGGPALKRFEENLRRFALTIAGASSGVTKLGRVDQHGGARLAVPRSELPASDAGSRRGPGEDVGDESIRPGHRCVGDIARRRGTPVTALRAMSSRASTVRPLARSSVTFTDGLPECSTSSMHPVSAAPRPAASSSPTTPAVTRNSVPGTARSRHCSRLDRRGGGMDAPSRN